MTLSPNPRRVAPVDAVCGPEEPEAGVAAGADGDRSLIGARLKFGVGSAEATARSQRVTRDS
jgi:hypothetical protein